jgi:signal transduction histidine kinase
VIFGSASRPISAGRGVIRLADDKPPGRVYRDGMHLRPRDKGQRDKGQRDKGQRDKGQRDKLRDKRRRDWLVAGVLAAASLVQLSLGSGPVHAQVLGSLFAVAICATVAFRQRYPTIAGVSAQAIIVLDFYTWHNLQLGFWTIAWWCSLYGMAVWSSRWRFAAGVAFAAVTDLLPVGRNAGQNPFNQAALGLAVGTVVVALLVRRIVGDRDRQARLAERERDVAAREAIVEERARIARELHDAVAHNVSMMVIQAGAERRVLGDTEDRGATREVLQTIEQIGRGALTEMRRLVGMLRTDSSDRLSPQPTLADLPTLITQVREAGLPVEFQVDGEPRDLPVGIELSAYRIVQEALTNALKHAGHAHAEVHVRYGPDCLELEITDDGAGAAGGAAGGTAAAAAGVPGGGHGLAGIRERVSLYGGKFDASARLGGGFAVRVLLPLR